MLLGVYNFFPVQVPGLGPAQALDDTILAGSRIAVESRSSSYYLREFDFLDNPDDAVNSLPKVGCSDSDLGSDWSDIGDDWPDASVDEPAP